MTASTKSKSSAKQREVVEIDDAPPWAPWLTQTAFVLTLVLLIARALMSEAVRAAFDVAPGATAAPSGPGATTTVILDAIGCLPALLVLLRRVADRTYVLRWTWSHVLFALLSIWAAMSFAWSTDRFVTAIAAATIVSAAALIWSTAQLVRSWLRLRIVAGVCVGLLFCYIAQGMIYRYVQHPDDLKIWNEHKDDILRERDMEPGSFQAQQFEKKFLSGEMMGFNQSPNSYAAVIVLLLCISAGVAIQRGVGGAVGWSILIALAAAPVALILVYTGSKTSGGTVFIAAVALLALARPNIATWLREHATAAYAGGVVVFFLGVAALIGHGIAHGSLPTDSLNFRWRYWVASAHMVKDHPIAGVGWGNYGPHYLAYRLPTAAEEVKDPHNFIVRGFAELGVIGGVLVLAWLARATWELTRPITPPAPAANSSTSFSIVRGIILICISILAAMALNALTAIDWSQPGAYLELELFGRLLWAGLLFIGLIVAVLRGVQRSDQAMDDSPAPWLLYALLVGLGVFFIHNLMDFCLMEAGPMTIFAILLGAASGVRMPSVAGQRQHRGVAISVLSIAALAWIVGVALVVIPVADAEQRAGSGDDAFRAKHPLEAANFYASAAQTLPWNGDYPYRAARAWMGVPGGSSEKVKSLLNQAIATDPANVTFYRTNAAYELLNPNPNPESIRADFDTILRIDPKNLQAILDYAELLQKFGDNKAAAKQYQAALKVNDGYDKTEPKRLAPEQIRQIQEAIAKTNSN